MVTSTNGYLVSIINQSLKLFTLNLGDSIMSSSALVKGTVFYAFNNRVNQMSGKYQIDIGDLSVPAQQALESMGLDIKLKDKQGPHVTCKSKFPIAMYDDAGQEITDPIANGSEGVFKIGFYEYKTPQGQSGKSPKLVSNKITKLEIFTEGEGEGGALAGDLDEAL